MTTPDEQQPRTEVPATPSVTTAPPRARWRFANVPSRLGRARTSTVVLAVLFVAVFVLWVYVRPETVATPAGTTGGVDAPVAPASTSSVPTTTSEAPTTTPDEPTTTASSESATESGTPTDETTTGATATTPSPSSTAGRTSTSAGVPTVTVPAPTS